MKVALKSGLVNVAAAGTAVPLSSSTLWAFGLQMTASSANAGVMYLGDENVAAANGREVAAGASVDFSDLLGSVRNGESAQSLVKVDLSQVYVDAANADEDMTFSYFVEVS